MAVLRINAGQLNRTNDKALAAKMSGIEVGDASNDLKAYCAGLRRSGKGPSKEHPCARCHSYDHWVVDCPHHPSTNEASGFKGRKGKKKGGVKANAQAAISSSPAPNPSTDPTALIAHTNLTTFNDKSEISHLLLSIDEATSFAAHSSQWILDSGASENMTGERAWFDSIQIMGSTVRIATAGGASLAPHSCGSVQLANHKGERVVLGRVLYVPGLAFNLLSVSRLVSIGASIEFAGSLCKVTTNDIEVLPADLEQRVWVVKGAQWETGVRALKGMIQALPAFIEPTSNALVSQGISPSRTKATWELRHLRLAHLGFDSMKLLFGGFSTGSSIARTSHSASDRGCACEGCVIGKITSVAQWESTRSVELDM